MANARTHGTQSEDTPDAILDDLRGPVRLRTLTTLRWLAVAGQIIAVAIVHFWLGFSVPLGLCIGAIAASVWLNIFVSLRFSPQRFLSDREAAAYIAFDIIQLSLLLGFTGGLQNPFSVLIVAPVTIAASILNDRMTVLIAVLAIATISSLAALHLPIPWFVNEALNLPRLYSVGVWVALSLSVVFFAAYAHRIAAESGQIKTALAASELVLAREERLAAIGGLAAAAAHELGTPLATIQVTAKEMANDLKGQGLLEEDAHLLVSQAERCRDILSRLSDRGDAGDEMMERIFVDLLLQEAAEPFLETPDHAAVVFEITSQDENDRTLILRRRPEIIYGLRNLIENAVGFAHSKVLVSAEWSDQKLIVAIQDDGPGFSADVLGRLGEPYLSARSSRNTRKAGGMGLGFFIAKTLLERSGGKIAFDNRAWQSEPDRNGAWVGVEWPRTTIEQPKKHAKT